MEWVNSKGQKWYLHKKSVIIGRNKLQTVTHFFRKVKSEGYAPLPVGYTVKETRNGLPVVKKL